MFTSYKNTEIQLYKDGHNFRYFGYKNSKTLPHLTNLIEQALNVNNIDKRNII